MADKEFQVAMALYMLGAALFLPIIQAMPITRDGKAIVILVLFLPTSLLLLQRLDLPEWIGTLVGYLGIAMCGIGFLFMLAVAGYRAFRWMGVL